MKIRSFNSINLARMHIDAASLAERMHNKRRDSLINEKGYVLCASCNGTGECAKCDGTGELEYRCAARSPCQIEQDYVTLDCECCDGTTECASCEGEGAVPSEEAVL